MSKKRHTANLSLIDAAAGAADLPSPVVHGEGTFRGEPARVVTYFVPEQETVLEARNLSISGEVDDLLAKLARDHAEVLPVSTVVEPAPVVLETSPVDVQAEPVVEVVAVVEAAPEAVQAAPVEVAAPVVEPAPVVDRKAVLLAALSDLEAAVLSGDRSAASAARERIALLVSTDAPAAAPAAKRATSPKPAPESVSGTEKDRPLAEAIDAIRAGRTEVPASEFVGDLFPPTAREKGNFWRYDRPGVRACALLGLVPSFVAGVVLFKSR
jgi:hypothetical protein